MGFHALALSRDGRTAAVGIEGGIQLVDLRTGDKRSARAGFSGSPNWLSFSPDGKLVASVNEDGSTMVWNAVSGAAETLQGRTGAAQQAVFSLDGKTLYGTNGGRVVTWDLVGNRSVRHPFRFTHDRHFNEAYDGHPGRFSPDGRLLAVGLKGKGIALLDSTSLLPLGDGLAETHGEVKALAFSPMAGRWPPSTPTVR